LAVVQANHYENITAHNLGCGRKEETLTLYCPASSGNASIRPSSGIESRIYQHQTIRIIKLDEYMGAKISRLDFLKIDTEGFENEVLAGAVELLRKFKPVVYIELSAEYLDSSRAAVSILRANGYRFDREFVLEECHNGENFIALPPAV
jgi:FkbM family methyltransferase